VIISAGRPERVLFFSGLVATLVIDAGGFQTFFETTIAQFGFFGFLVVIVNNADLVVR
jgi:hypothetical protein